MINGYIVGDERVVARLRELPARTQATLTAAVTRLAVGLQAKIKTDKLSGQVLKRRTGTLSRSINYRLNQGVTEITASVGTNVEYAARHEYGFTGTESVKEHLRQIKQAFGRPISPVSVTVRAFTREVSYPAHSFLRTALQDMAPEIRAGLSSALQQAIRP